MCASNKERSRHLRKARWKFPWKRTAGFADSISLHFFFQAEDGIRAFHVTGVQTCALPIYSPFDRDAALAEPRLPGREIHLGDREGEVQVAAAVVGRDDAEGEADGLSGAALLEQEQHLVSRHLDRREARVAVELREAEQRLVERRGAPHVGHVQRRLEHPGDAGRTAHTSSPRSTVTAWPPSP